MNGLVFRNACFRRRARSGLSAVTNTYLMDLMPGHSQECLDYPFVAFPSGKLSKLARSL